MAQYRIYVLDAEGHVIRAFDREYADDLDAVEGAYASLEDRDLEIWTGVRKVAHLDAQKRTG